MVQQETDTVMVQYGSLLFMFPLMVQQETDTVMVQYGSVVAIAIAPSNIVLPSRRRLMQDNYTVAVPAQASSLGKMVLPSTISPTQSSQRRLMQDNSTVAVSVDSALPTTTVIVQQVRVLPSRRSLMQENSTVAVIHSVVATARASC